MSSAAFRDTAAACKSYELVAMERFVLERGSLSAEVHGTRRRSSVRWRFGWPEKPGCPFWQPRAIASSRVLTWPPAAGPLVCQPHNGRNSTRLAKSSRFPALASTSMSSTHFPMVIRSWWAARPCRDEDSRPGAGFAQSLRERRLAGLGVSRRLTPACRGESEDPA